MQKPTRKKLRKWLTIIVVIYVVIGIALYFFQEKILFHPEPLPADHQYDFNTSFEELNVAVNAEKNLSIVQFTVPDSACKGVVLYFHGNRRNISRYAQYAPNFTTNGYEVWMIDYPGFGKSTGERSEKIMYEDAALLYRLARSRFSKDSILIYGKSLGSGIASQLASVKDCRRLILETPYYSIHALMNHYAFVYPATLLAKYHFPTYQYLRQVEVPVTIIHGTGDEIIPFSQSARLKTEVPSVQLISIKKGKHNNLSDSPFFHQQLDSLLNSP